MTAQLSWVSTKTGSRQHLLSHVPVCAGAEVLMAGRNYVGAWPEEYFLLRTYSPLVRAALLNLGRAFEHNRVGDRFPVRNGGGGEAVAGPVRLMASGFVQAHRWLFCDAFGNYSPVIRATRFGDIHVDPSAKALGVGVSGFRTRITTCIDPTLDLLLILPGQTAGEISLQSLLRGEFTTPEKGFDEAQGDEAMEAVSHFAHEFIDDDPSKRWDFSLSNDRVELGENEIAEVELIISHGGGPGTAFAVVESMRRPASCSHRRM